MSNRILLSALTLALSLAANLGLSARARADLPASYARYEIKRGHHAERLEVVRTHARVEHRYLDRAITEVWQRSPHGELEHWKVFHHEGRAVHYTQGDLRTVHVLPTWEQLATLIDPVQRSALRRVRTRRSPEGSAMVLEGKVDGQRTRVIWSEQRGWAEEITLGVGKQRTGFRLLASDACEGERCEPTDLRAVREIEFADLGDSERDPFVRRFLASVTGHQH